jgi:DNA-binding CsgD family transcriptional regulator
MMRGLLESDARGLALAGSAGVGKTRLALEYLQDAERSGAAVVRVVATRAAAPLPLGAFDPLLPAFHHGEAAGVDDRADLIRRCAAFLVESAGGRPLVLFADDAHLLDETSAILLHQLAVTGAAFVVVTIRSGEPAPDPVVSFWRDDAVQRLEVRGLRADTVEQLLLAVLGGPVDRATAHRLTILSQGNVLFLREIVLGALEDGTLSNEVGIWRLVGPVSPSPRLAELVENRLSGLSPEEQRFLEVLALGEPLSTAELKGLGSTEVAASLERQGLIASQADGRRLSIRLGHSIYADVIRDRTPLVRAREVAESLAGVVEDTGARRREDVLRIATWRLEGGTFEPRLMLEAALTARWRYDFPLAERLAEAAVRSGAGFDAALLVAQLASLQGRGVEAEAALGALWAEATDDRQRGLVAIARLDNHVFHLGHVDVGIQMAEEAEAAISESGWRDEIAAKRSSVVAAQYGPRAGAEISVPLLETAKGRALVWAGINSAFTLARMGRFREAHEASDRAREAHTALSEPINWYAWIHDFHVQDILSHEGELDAAHTGAMEMYQHGMIDRSPEAQGWFSWLLTKLVGERGYPHSAALHGRTAVGLFHQLGRPRFEHFALGHLALALALAGDERSASETLVRMDELGLPTALYFTTEVLQARAWTAANGGDVPKARHWLREAVTLGADIGDLVGQASALHGLARIGHADEAAEELLGLADRIEGRLGAARASHAAALAAGDTTELEAVSQRFEEMGAYLLAAEAAADGAVAWYRDGEPRRAARTEQRANLLAERCENPVTPALQAVKGRSRLTRAEREIALLAVAGKSSKEIAAHLGISVRTVDNHLQHAYEKLGISRRNELAEALQHSAG